MYIPFTDSALPHQKLTDCRKSNTEHLTAVTYLFTRFVYNHVNSLRPLFECRGFLSLYTTNLNQKYFKSKLIVAYTTARVIL